MMFIEFFVAYVFDLPRGVSVAFITLLLGFAFKCSIGMEGLGAYTNVYDFAKGVGYTGFFTSAGGEGGFGETF